MDLDKAIEKFIEERKNKVDCMYIIEHRVLPEMIFDEKINWILKLEANGFNYLFNVFKNTYESFTSDSLKENDFVYETYDNDGIRLYSFDILLDVKKKQCNRILVALDAYYNYIYYFISEFDGEAFNLKIYDGEFVQILKYDGSKENCIKEIFKYLIEE